MYVRNITGKDGLETLKLASLCFEYPFTTEDLPEEKYLNNLLTNPKEKLHAHWHTQLGAFDDDGTFMASLAVLPYQFYFDGISYPGNGIGNVCTYPHHRKKGAIRAMFEKMLTDSYAEGQVFSYLYPFSESFYGRYGYHRLTNSIRYELRLNGFPDTPYDGSFHLLTDQNPGLLSEFQEAYKNFAPDYNLCVNRESFDWKNVTDAKAYYNNQYAYLYKNSEGSPVGYLVFRKDGRVLRCRELIFDSFSTLKAIFSFVKTYSADFDILQFHAPACVHMEHFCTDFSMNPGVMKITSNGMVRVLNVQTVLEHAKYLGSGSLCLKITDSLLPANHGFFLVNFTDGSATSVQFIPMDAAGEQQADIELSVSLFSAAISGNYHSSDFDYVAGIQTRSIEKRNQIFYRKKCFINNYF